MRHGDRRGDFERRRDVGRDSEPHGKAEPWAEQHHAHGTRGRGGRGGPGRGRHRRARAQRGDVRTAILLVLADEPMHGYQIMQAMSDRTGGAWRPSPGAVYPTIAQLEDEGLVTKREEGGRRLVTLTSEGRAYLEERSARLGDPFADFAEQPSWPDLREPMQELQAAARQIVVSGSTAQVKAAAEVLAQTRRSLYLILAGEPEGAGERGDD
jgi:DNA-binding PadR family transcriptional regulator